MKSEFIIFGITGFFIYNAYKGDVFTRNIMAYTKYIKMGLYGFIGLSMYLFIKKHPSQSSSLFYHANELIKYFPIDKRAGKMFEPVFNLTKDIHFTDKIMESMNNYNDATIQPQQSSYGLQSMTPQMKRMMNSGNGPNDSTNRSVSGTKKKFVAARQQWRCASCQNMLDHTYEVDHIQELQYGGTNHVDNLEALCRNCHGQKTVASHL